MSDESTLRQRSLLAMKAVTAGALLFAGIACSDDDDTNEPDWNIQDNQNSADAGGDTAVADVSQNDTGEACNTESYTGVCPDHCTIDEDLDCCEASGGCWWGGECDPWGCVVPGPFVPPTVVA